jgi:hypothetical protein
VKHFTNDGDDDMAIVIPFPNVQRRLALRHAYWLANMRREDKRIANGERVLAQLIARLRSYGMTEDLVQREVDIYRGSLANYLQQLLQKRSGGAA